MRRCIVAALAGLLTIWVGVALASPTVDQGFAPVRAPEELRAAQLEAIDAALARRMATGDEISGDELLTWLADRSRTLGGLLEATGLDPARIIMSAIDEDDAVGGPFIALPRNGDGAYELDSEALVAHVIASVPLLSPVRAPHRFTSGFGRRIDPFRGRAAFHRGIDLAANRGTGIYAPASGTVIRAGRSGGFGNMVEIDHGNGVVTRYAHLHTYLVHRGDVLGAGERIGTMGRSGRATGVHLHYEVLVNGRHVNPARFLDAGRELQATRADG